MARLPQDLILFIAQGTTTQDILTNPVFVPSNSNHQTHMTETRTFSVTTHSTPAEPGGGTANIAFLDRSESSPGSSTNEAQMGSFFEITTVQANE